MQPFSRAWHLRWFHLKRWNYFIAQWNHFHFHRNRRVSKSSHHRDRTIVSIVNWKSSQLEKYHATFHRIIKFLSSQTEESRNLSSLYQLFSSQIKKITQPFIALWRSFISIGLLQTAIAKWNFIVTSIEISFAMIIALWCHFHRTRLWHIVFLSFLQACMFQQDEYTEVR